MKWFRLGALSMMAFVILGAFGAHGLKSKISPEMLEIYKTGIFYHGIHGIALFIVAWISQQIQSSKVAWAGILFSAGLILFSGSLYLLAITGILQLGMITPLGGLCFISGWFFLLLAPIPLQR